MKRIEIIVRIPSAFAEGLVEVICKIAELVGGGAYAVITDDEALDGQKQDALPRH